MAAVTHYLAATHMAPSDQHDDLAARQAAARRTAWIAAAVALAILVAFVLSVVLR